ncbi:MAG: hypothetical protein KAS93_08040, partial [Gammaproteobacteria bacterium]|nr:hypothetical protein [Gammaproteobacteria bacterium]
TITLNIELADWRLLAGDYWIKEIREAVDASGHELLTEELPRGIEHHYTALGRVMEGEFIPYEGPECRRLNFPALTDIEAKDICFENNTCEMPKVQTVQDAIDHLCQEKDLRWHNKHLHGWGIVCGLIGECGPDTLPDPQEPGVEPTRQEVRITSGYALDCKGNDLVLDEDHVFNLLERIEEIEEEQQPILSNGSGTVCLRLDGVEDGLPDIGVEKYSNNRHGFGGIFEGTLLQDFIEDCLLDLIAALRDEFTNGKCEGIDEIHCEGDKGLVSFQRKKAATFFNLVIQYINNYTNNGNVIFLSHKEHLIIRCVYLRLREILQSKVFCAMFEEQNFPEYPFPDRQATTFFGKNAHTRVKVHPEGERVYTYGGTDNTINVYNIKHCGLVEVIEMPSAGGAEIKAISFSQDGGLLYAVADLRGVDSIFGMARIEEDTHVWERSTVFCNLSITEMQQSPTDPNVIYAIGYGRGLFYLRPDILFEQAKPQPVPVYDFDAIGHMDLDESDNRIYATWQHGSGLTEDEYDRVAILDLTWSSGPDENRDVNLYWDLRSSDGTTFKGTDGLAVRPDMDSNDRTFVFVEVDHFSDSTKKMILAFSKGVHNFIGLVEIDDDSELSLAYHRREDVLLVAIADGYRLQRIDFIPDDEDGNTSIEQIPVQIMPVDLAIDRDNGQTYILNYGLDFNSSYLGNSITSIPEAELDISDAYIPDLIAYHSAIMDAFISLIASLIQYVKDCFCHHFLVKCPTCADDDVIYLATIEIRDNKVVRICNFDKRKTVKSFPTVGYWMSVIPVVPLVKKLFEYVCCSSIPGLFDKYRGNIYKYPTYSATMAAGQRKSYMKTENAQMAVRTYQRADSKSFFRDKQKSFKVAGKLAYDGTIKQAGKARVINTGVKKEALLDSPVTDAVSELQRNNIQVTTKPYDPKKAGSLLQAYTTTPSKIKNGERVTLYEEKGKVVMYAVEKQSTGTVTGVSPEVQANLEQLEQRKYQLSDFADLDADLARVEARKNSILELDAARAGLATLQAEKVAATEDVAVLRAQTESLKAQREAETLQINTMKSERDVLTQSMEELNAGLQELSTAHSVLRVEINKSRPTSDIAGVTSEVATSLRENGILTVNDLAIAKESTITDLGVDANTARDIIGDAVLRLK